MPIEYRQLSDKICFGCNAKELVIVSAKFVLPLYCQSLSRFQFWLQLKCNRLALLQEVLRVGTCKCPLSIVIFQIRLVLAAMQKNWSLLEQNLCLFRIVLLVKLVCIVEFSPALAAVQMQ